MSVPSNNHFIDNRTCCPVIRVGGPRLITAIAGSISRFGRMAGMLGASFISVVSKGEHKTLYMYLSEQYA